MMFVFELQQCQMRNIKISFQHPNYLHPFKLTLSPPPSAHLEYLNPQRINQNLRNITEQLVLTQEEQDIIQSFNLGYKAEFANQYQKAVEQRKNIDYLGVTKQQHFQFFEGLCHSRTTTKDLLQLRHYLLRNIAKPQMAEHTDFNQWIQLLLDVFRCFGLNHPQKKDMNYWQLESFIAFYVTVQGITRLIEADQEIRIQLKQKIARIQDKIVEGYLQIKDPHLQQHAMSLFLKMVIAAISHLKTSQKGTNSPMRDSKKGKGLDSVVYWVINFTPEPMKKGKSNILTEGLNTHTILQLVAKLVTKSHNVLIVEECLSFISLLFKEVASFAELLFLITEAIRFEFPGTLASLGLKVKSRQFRGQGALRCTLHCQISDIMDHQKDLELYKLKEMTKTKREGQKMFHSALREINRSVIALSVDFDNYRKGKVVFRRIVEVNGVKSQQIEEHQVLNIERLAEVRHQQYKSQEVISMELYQKNEELIKVNKWLQQKLLKSEAALAEMLQVNAKVNLQAKLSLRSRVYGYRILQSVSPTRRMQINPVTKNMVEPTRIPSQSMSVFLPIESMRKSYREQDVLRRQSTIVKVMEQGGGQTEFHPQKSRTFRESKREDVLSSILFAKTDQELPKLEVVRNRQVEKNESKIKEKENTSQIFKEASSMIVKALQVMQKDNKEEEEKPKSVIKPVLPPPPPPPPSLTPPPTLNTPPTLPSLPPPPSAPSSLPGLPPPPPSLSDALKNNNSSPFGGLPPPPPPPAMGLGLAPPPPPPPPPPLSLPGLGLPKVGGVKKPQGPEMKTIGWNVLDKNYVKNTFWQTLDTNSLTLDKQNIIENFSKKVSKQPQTQSPSRPKIEEQKSLLKGDRIRNIQIILKKLHLGQMSFPIVGQVLMQYDANYLQQEFITGLINLAPTAQQKEQFMKVDSLEGNYSIADKFFYYLNNYVAYESKLGSILFREDYPEMAIDFSQKLKEFTKFYEQLQRDSFFQGYLEYLLAIGNQLNEGTHRANAKGFKLEHFQKSYMLLAQDKETTLFEYVLQTIQQNDPKLLEEPSIDNRPRLIVALPILVDDFNYFEEKSQDIKDCILLSDKNPEDKSSGYFLSFYVQTQQEISEFKRRLEHANRVFNTVRQFYGCKMSSEELAKMITSFREKVDQWRVKEKRKAERANE